MEGWKKTEINFNHRGHGEKTQQLETAPRRLVFSVFSAPLWLKLSGNKKGHLEKGGL